MSVKKKDESNLVCSDIARIYGRRIKCSLIESPLNHLIIENSKGNLYFSKGTREMARWAQQVRRFFSFFLDSY